MDRGMVIVVGALLTFTSSWLGLVVFPFHQLGNEKPFVKGPGEEYPVPLSDQARAGAKVYQANGCIYCHSQQVRSEKFGSWMEDGQLKTGSDIKRGWGVRRTVPRDYIYDSPVMLGTIRTGPDLANVGSRRYSEAWHHIHLLNPRSVNSWSIMPSFAFLYTRQPVSGGRRSEKALALGRQWTVDPGRQWSPTEQEWASIDGAGPIHRDFWLNRSEEDYEIVPSADAENLVAYLMELRKAETPLPEAKE